MNPLTDIHKIQFHGSYSRSDYPGVVMGRFGDMTCTWDRALTESELAILNNPKKDADILVYG